MIPISTLLQVMRISSAASVLNGTYIYIPVLFQTVIQDGFYGVFSDHRKE